MSTAFAEPPRERQEQPPKTVPSKLSWAAIVSAILALLCFIATPLMPVHQVQSSVSWPQNGTLKSVSAPLVSVAPEKLHAEIPLKSRAMLDKDSHLIFGTIPSDGPDAGKHGLFVVTDSNGGINIMNLGGSIISVKAEDLDKLGNDAKIVIDTDSKHFTAEIPGTKYTKTYEDDIRPQVTGMYTDIGDTGDHHKALSDAGLSVNVDVNSRFTTSPTVIKTITMWLGALFALASLWLLRKMDHLDNQTGEVRRRARHRGLWKVDLAVFATMVFWYIFGANTPDDGFILTMARSAHHSGYIANYYRWYGVPEAPFGTPYYDLLSWITYITSASIVVRLPALLLSMATWLLISRSLLPRFGAIVADRRVAVWSAGLMFLAFWMPYNNGLRPEPIIAFGSILTWALMERAIEQRRLFPAALGTLSAAFTLTCGPTGLMAVGVFLVALPRILSIAIERLPMFPKARVLAYAAMLLPIAAAGVSVFVPVFADQTLAAIMESSRLRSKVGPSLPWYQEYFRYDVLLGPTEDGSLTRRFAMLILAVCVVLVMYAMTRYGTVPGTSKDPVARLLIIVILTTGFLMFTPTKWTHHFGIYAGVASVAGALGSVVISRIALSSVRARTYTIAGAFFLLALTLSGTNSFWYISSFGVPWYNMMPQFHAITFESVFLLFAFVALIIAVVQSFIPSTAQKTEKTAFLSRAISAPIAVSCGLIVVLALGSFGKAFASQYPAYSVGMGNVRALKGDDGYLANDVMVETNTNDSFLQPVNGSLGDSLKEKDKDNQGFTADGVPGYINPMADPDSAPAPASRLVTAAGNKSSNQNSSNNTQDSFSKGNNPNSGASKGADGAGRSNSSANPSNNTGTSGGTRNTKGVNGSVASLPFGLDANKVPVVGSIDTQDSGALSITTSWYKLPKEHTDANPLIVVSASGKIKGTTRDGLPVRGQELTLEFGKTESNGEVTKVGGSRMMDIGPAPMWRNLRLPLSEVPAGADTVRIHATDTSTSAPEWIAFTPPRVPNLESLQDLVPNDTPMQLDWSTALQFPRQRVFDHYAGVAETPKYRISPENKDPLSAFMDFNGGGSLATVDAVNSSTEVPSYLKDDWNRNWGSVAKYTPRRTTTGEDPQPAEVQTRTETRSGLWRESHMRVN